MRVRQMTTLASLAVVATALAAPTVILALLRRRTRALTLVGLLGAWALTCAAVVAAGAAGDTETSKSELRAGVFGAVLVLFLLATPPIFAVTAIIEGWCRGTSENNDGRPG